MAGGAVQEMLSVLSTALKTEFKFPTASRVPVQGNKINDVTLHFLE